MVTAKRAAVEDLHHTMDPDVGAAERVILAQAYSQMVGMRYLAHDGERPDSQLLDSVVFVVADHQYAMLTAAAQQCPDLSSSYHCASRSAMSLLSSISA